MRLTKSQQQIIIEQVIKYFGPNLQLWIFGSRVIDTKRGGDFDFYIETSINDANQLFQKRIELQVALHDTNEFADEKIDLVIHSPLYNEYSSIAKHALQQGVRLI